MKKIFQKIVVLLALGGLVFSSCKISTDTSEKSLEKYASLSGKAVFVNAEDSSSIYVTLDKTDGLRTADVLSSQGLSSEECYSVSENSTSNSRKIVAYANCLKDGSFKFENLEAGIYTVYATAPDSQERAVFRNITIDEEEEKIILEELKLTATGTLSGKITLDSSESNNSGFTVYIGGTSYMAKTGLSGDFTITGIPAGKDYELFIEYGTYTYYWKNADVSAFQNYELGTINLSTDEIKSSSLFKDGENGTDGKDGKNGTDGKDGKNGTDGKDGKNGTDGKDGTPIIWKGSFESEDEIANPQNLWAYYNTSDGCSYIYDGNSWNLLASKGDNAQSEGLKTYSITYELNGGSFTSTPDFVHFYGKTTQLPTPVKTGYHFSGWYTNEDFSGKKITSLSADFNSNIKLYAYWKSGFTVPGGVDGLNSFLASLNSEETNTIIITEDFPDLSVIASALKNNSTKKVVLDLSFTSIAFVNDSEFQDVKNLIGIELPESVISIGSYAFSGCSGLTSVTIPSSVTSIYDYAFSGCSGLSQITVDKNNPKYDSRDDCNGIIETSTNTLMTGCKNTIIPSSVTSIGEGAFYGCSGLTSVTIPSSVTSIGSEAFRGCSGLTSVIIPSSVTSIGYNAFSWCDNIEEITIPQIMLSKGFSYCGINTMSLQIVRISDGATSIGDGAFSQCYFLSFVVIPSSVTSIGNFAFRECYSLNYVHIPSSVTSIGEGAFRDCVNIEEIIVDKNNPKYDSRDDCHGIIETSTNTLMTGCKCTLIPSSVTSIGSYAFYDCNGLTSVTIPSSVTSIGDYAFYYCDLRSVTIHSSVTSIGDYAFYGCYNLTEVNITDLEAWCKISFSNYDSNPLYYAKYLYLNDVRITSLEIPNTVTSIGNYAFYNCSGLRSVTIPSSVTSIGERAFYNCSGLTKVNITDLKAWCKISFSNGNSNPLTYAGHLYLNDVEITSLEIPNTITSIKQYTFYYCIGLTSVTIPSSVTSIGSGAFRGCIGLTSVTIPSSVTSIGDSAFYYCDGLTSVTIPSSVTFIGNSAFSYCDGLTSVTISSSVTSIGKEAFNGCTKLQTITFEDTTTWYRTTSSSNWENKTGGTQTDVSSATLNATNFTSDYYYYDYYWYKL